MNRQNDRFQQAESPDAPPNKVYQADTTQGQGLPHESESAPGGPTLHPYSWQERLKSQPFLRQRADAQRVKLEAQPTRREVQTDALQNRPANRSQDMDKRGSEAERPVLAQTGYFPTCSSQLDLREEKETKLVPKPPGSESSSNFDDIEVSFQDDTEDSHTFEPGNNSGASNVSRPEKIPLNEEDYMLELQHKMQKFNSQEMKDQVQLYNQFFLHQGFPQGQALPSHPQDEFQAGEAAVRSLPPQRGQTRKTSVCPLCGKSFSNSSYLATHFRSHTGEKPFVCDKCGMQFPSIGRMNEHKRSHEGERPFRCEICGEQFGKSINLVEHKRKHSGERPFSCDVCGKSFARSSVLYRHRATHTKEKPFQCVLCDKTFTRKGALQRHERVHSGHKPFKCDVCHKSFAQNESLSMHKAIHTGEKLFRCEICDKTFGNRLYLYSHKKIHSEERPYVCNECGDAFKRSGDLNVHKTTHSIEKAFHCEFCNKRFTKRSNMQRHKKLHIAKAEEELREAQAKSAHEQTPETTQSSKD